MINLRPIYFICDDDYLKINDPTPLGTPSVRWIKLKYIFFCVLNVHKAFEITATGMYNVLDSEILHIFNLKSFKNA